MAVKDTYGDVAVTRLDGHVIQCEIQRPPNNFFDIALINDLSDCFEDIDQDQDFRAIVLCSDGKHFCAGANFGSSERAAELEKRTDSDRNPLYDQAVRLFRCKKPVVAAVQGAAVGGGFGLALMADFRVVCPATRMTASVPGSEIDPDNPAEDNHPGLVSPAVLLMAGEDAPNGRIIQAAGGKFASDMVYANQGVDMGIDVDAEDVVANQEAILDMTTAEPKTQFWRV